VFRNDRLENVTPSHSFGKTDKGVDLRKRVPGACSLPARNEERHTSSRGDYTERRGGHVGIPRDIAEK